MPGARAEAGEDGLSRTLAAAQILVLLLPSTPATANLLDGHRLSLLPQGAAIINAGRGTLIDDTALLAALDRGHVGQATLDVFRVEPLPAQHPYWHHPRVTVTPHIAADSRPETASAVVAENIRRSQAGLPLLHRVDRTLGY
jgi:glyoxylate/hydroxypyruvate reductase A